MEVDLNAGRCFLWRRSGGTHIQIADDGPDHARQVLKEGRREGAQEGIVKGIMEAAKEGIKEGTKEEVNNGKRRKDGRKEGWGPMPSSPPLVASSSGRVVVEEEDAVEEEARGCALLAGASMTLCRAACQCDRVSALSKESTATILGPNAIESPQVFVLEGRPNTSSSTLQVFVTTWLNLGEGKGGGHLPGSGFKAREKARVRVATCLQERESGPGPASLRQGIAELRAVELNMPGRRDG
jgi:hypothetical protein